MDLNLNIFSTIISTSKKSIKYNRLFTYPLIIIILIQKILIKEGV